ncbi:3-dehydroquinate synthase [Rhizobium sp. VS19-DR104.2]|uniref:3-dehydroquinate synthase n=1 Tax=unclassified Rhizobium TaxID=2613769 RepID=UPI001CC79BDB|nr:MULTISPECIES: 3-dehydroquinate synthase [unclassified Rhizobium]MBZ5763747.1 3-dehydroquinate synthase [Rhizobium sp. VS19-DR96]MBZ5769611.1 3-dehydroquinate synthase [Rhizobium sp. VS19-DR129.2]MBZ5776369.1 3-dehydroquinate synthase [Rhizobium sp. VS19-DRK62.2]MBZ5787576.1 3-dehydroquinate synthase [Rhizobium sp. VS19-DR121]MBZ5804931.1 3-dehydroquinate synthase [Rhizobium sp. VS19-DR181]
MSYIASPHKTQSIYASFEIPYTMEVHFTSDLFAVENPLLKEVLSRAGCSSGSDFCIFVDSGLTDKNPILADRIKSYLDASALSERFKGTLEIISGGELIKNEVSCLAFIYDRLHTLCLDRHSIVIGMGGGAFLDALGYASATFHRGVRHIRIPTTLLSQCDSGVGVKNAVNAFGMKNTIGTFMPPSAVLNDITMLSGLTTKEISNGLAECIKIALVFDRSFFFWIKENINLILAGDREAQSTLIVRSAELHFNHICRGGDPFERERVRPLDHGHWAAHKLESISRGRLSHGEAVSIGLAIDATYSLLLGLMSSVEHEMIIETLRAAGLPTWDNIMNTCTDDSNLAIMDGLREYQEHIGGDFCITLCAGIGTRLETNTIELDKMLQAVKLLAPPTRLVS